MKFKTPEGIMKIDSNSYVQFIDKNGTYWSFLFSQVELVKEKEESNSSNALDNIALRLMSTNEDYINTLKSLVKIDPESDSNEL